MSVSSNVTIAGESIDINAPCDVLTALRKIELKIATGSLRETVRFDEDEVTYNKSNLADLQTLITRYDGLCRQANGQKPRRSAIGVQWV